MAQGNWNPDVIKAKPRCRLCRRVVLIKDLVRLDGVNPAHKNGYPEEVVGTKQHKEILIPD